jgi:valyl-tRNA synthetase
MTGLIDEAAERAKLEKERGKVAGGIKGKQAKLSNEKFTSSAPPEIVQREREGLAQLEEQLKAIESAIRDLQG